MMKNITLAWLWTFFFCELFINYTLLVEQQKVLYRAHCIVHFSLWNYFEFLSNLYEVATHAAPNPAGLTVSANENNSFTHSWKYFKSHHCTVWCLLNAILYCGHIKIVIISDYATLFTCIYIGNLDSSIPNL